MRALLLKHATAGAVLTLALIALAQLLAAYLALTGLLWLFRRVTGEPRL